MKPAIDWSPAHPRERVASIEVEVQYPSGDVQARDEALQTGAEEIGRQLLRDGIIQVRDGYDFVMRTSWASLRLVFCDRSGSP